MRAPAGTRPSTTRNGSRPADGRRVGRSEVAHGEQRIIARTVPRATSTASLSAREADARQRAPPHR
jgi:hypothetical protein